MSELKIIPCTFKAACEFVNKYHRHHNAPVGCKFCIAVTDGEKIRGVAICGRPVSRYYDDGLTCEIVRVCTDGAYNACSMLYGACCRTAKAMGYAKIITYTLISENGASLRASGFESEGKAGGLFWTGSRNRNQDIPHEYKTRWVKDLGKTKHGSTKKGGMTDERN